VSELETDAVALDACALIAFLAGEPGAEVVERQLLRAAAGQARLSMHRVNLGEVYHLKLRAAGIAAAEALLDDLRELPIRIADGFDRRLMQQAARLKLAHRLSYVDAIAAGWAVVDRASLLTTDRRAFAPAAAAADPPVLWAR
jgi:predicted nucleic acid-binding protein